MMGRVQHYLIPQNFFNALRSKQPGRSGANERVGESCNWHGLFIGGARARRGLKVESNVW